MIRPTYLFQSKFTTWSILSSSSYPAIISNYFFYAVGVNPKDGCVAHVKSELYVAKSHSYYIPVSQNVCLFVGQGVRADYRVQNIQTRFVFLRGQHFYFRLKLQDFQRQRFDFRRQFLRGGHAVPNRYDCRKRVL